MPVPDHARPEIVLSDPWDYGKLAEAVEAWGFRTSQARGEAIGRRETAYAWLEEEDRPVVAMLREADLIGGRTDAEAYLRVSTERYRLMRTHRWDEDVIARLIEGGVRAPGRRR